MDNFQRVLIFGYFEEHHFYKNKTEYVTNYHRLTLYSMKINFEIQFIDGFAKISGSKITCYTVVHCLSTGSSTVYIHIGTEISGFGNNTGIAAYNRFTVSS